MPEQTSTEAQGNTQQSKQSNYRFRRSAASAPRVTANLSYLAPARVRPYTYMYEPPEGTPRQNCEYAAVTVPIMDARALTNRPELDREGFELWDAPSHGVDFADQDSIRTKYYAEAVELVKLATGADHAYVFDHQIRRREAGRPPLTFGRDLDQSRPGAAGRVHNDYTESSGRSRFELVASGPELAAIKRFAIVNVWRSIAHKIVDTPLALCDARTVSVCDLEAADIFYPGRKGEIYLVKHSIRHHWMFFSEMDKHEALVFKQFDSQENGVARFTPHAAFDLPDIPAHAPLRESIELRCVVTYD